MFLLMVFFLLIAVAILVFPIAQALRMKLASYVHGLQFMMVANDNPTECMRSNCIPMNVERTPGSRRVIRVVFIRHGQSVWNSIFNSYGISWPIRVVKAVFHEMVFLFTDPFSSVIIDSPLSSKGNTEAQELAYFMRTAKGKITFDPSSSVIVCSNLRRAMETAVIGMGPRMSFTHERILVDSSLQEGSRNIDAQSLSTQRGKIIPFKIGKVNTPRLLSSVLDARLNAGNRTSQVDVYGRMNDFVMHLFGGSKFESYRPGANTNLENTALKEVIVVGHSGYFRCFFRRFLPSSVQHIAKEKKLKNCGVVAFDLVHNEATDEIFIDASTITVLHKGF